MPLTVEIKLNGKLIASSKIANVSDLADVSDYTWNCTENGSEVTGLEDAQAWGQIRGHKRKQSVWALVSRVAAQAADTINRYGPF
ncbi:MAG: hypothetical protein AAF903_14785 [Pseudomonadota bacterium]